MNQPKPPPLPAEQNTLKLPSAKEIAAKNQKAREQAGQEPPKRTPSPMYKTPYKDANRATVTHWVIFGVLLLALLLQLLLFARRYDTRTANDILSSVCRYFPCAGHNFVSTNITLRQARLMRVNKGEIGDGYELFALLRNDSDYLRRLPPLWIELKSKDTLAGEAYTIQRVLLPTELENTQALTQVDHHILLPPQQSVVYRVHFRIWLEKLATPQVLPAIALDTSLAAPAQAVLPPAPALPSTLPFTYQLKLLHNI